MENRAQTLFKGAMKYGMYLGPALVAVNILFYVAFDLSRFGYWSLMGIMSLQSIVPFVFGIYLCMKRFRDVEYGGTLSYAEGLRFGTMLMLFAGIILAGYSLVFNNWVDPAYVGHVQEVVAEKTIEYSQEIGLPDSDIDELIGQLDSMKVEETRKSKLLAPLMSIPMTAFAGLLVSLAVAAILKRKGDPFESAMKNIES